MTRTYDYCLAKRTISTERYNKQDLKISTRRDNLEADEAKSIDDDHRAGGDADAVQRVGQQDRRCVGGSATSRKLVLQISFFLIKSCP